MPLPPLPRALLHAMLPPDERDEILADVEAEFVARAQANDVSSARRWLWRQVFASAPSLFSWTGWRAVSGFEPTANAYRPGGPMLKGILADIRYAARRLRARPTYSLLAILTLALGIGGTAAIFGIARPILFEQLPYSHAGEVVRFWMNGSWNEREFTYLRGKIPGYRSVAFYREGGFTLSTDDASPAQMVSGVETSTELFDVLGAAPMVGHDFERGSDVPGAEPVVIVSYGLWQELGGNQSIIGTRLNVSGIPRTVIGVMPRTFWFPTPSTRLWFPRPINPDGGNGSYGLLGHVLPGQDPGNMTEHVKQLTTMLDERFDYDVDWDKTKNAHVDTLADVLIGPMRPALMATMIGMGLILLIACTNVTALMLGQVEGRATELAVRAALGATRRRLTQPLVVEALLIGVVAATIGGGLAAAGFSTFANALPLGAWGDAAQFDWTLFAIALVIAVAAAVLVVLVPSTSLWRNDLRGDVHRALTRARTGGVHSTGGRIERGLVIVQVALAMLIATGASLLVRSVSNLYAIDPGIDPRGVAIVDATSANNMTVAERRIAIARMIDEIATLPGVTTVAAGGKLPLRGSGNSFGITVEGKDFAERTNTYFRIVTPGYFEAFGIKVLSGAVFDKLTVGRQGEVDIVINDALAQKYFPGENPIGRRVGGGFNVPQRIIGVVANVAEGSLTDKPSPARYFVSTQIGWFETNASLVIRMSAPTVSPALLDAARQAVNKIEPRFAVRQTTTASRMLDEAVGPARQIMTLLGILSGLALVLGAVGIYGVISHFVTRRMRDWAIRVALGLRGSGVIARILGQGATLIAAGVLVGAAGTFALSKVLISLLYGVTRFDPVAFAGAATALLVTGLVAAFIPARRAANVDPALVLREQA